MGTAERTEREDLRERIVEAARDIVGEEGLDALSMRALAVRIGYSPGTIYLHFQDKDELLRSVMEEGFTLLGATMQRELDRLPASSSALEQYAATGRAYARFALENTGYFRAMFKMPRVANVEMCPGPVEGMPAAQATARDFGVGLVRQAIEAGEISVADAEQTALVGWGLVHGLTSLYLSGHLGEVETHEGFMEVLENALEAVRVGWTPRAGGG